VIEFTRGEAMKSAVLVQTNVADGLPLIEGDRVQLQQVILNLIINAVEAMSGIAEGPRELVIKSGEAAHDGVFVEVQDSGPSRPSTRLNPVVWAWGYRSAGRSSKRMGDRWGQLRMCPAGPFFDSRCPREERWRILFGRAVTRMQ
jgi:K+-sensing histidine kinase KdpD